jgi:N-methylhydantoinase A
VPVYTRDSFAPGAAIPGPALIVESATSTYVTERFAARIDAGGALVLEATP